MRRLIGLILLAAATVASAQTYTGATGQIPIPGPMRSNYQAATVGNMIDVRDLHGAFVKSVTDNSDGTYDVELQTSANASDSVTITVAESFLDLDDTPNAFTAGLCVKVNSTATALELGTCAGTASADGVVDGGSVSGDELTLTRTESLVDVVIAGLPETTTADIDARVATYARATPSGTIAEAQIPAAIARDSELPDVSGFLTQTQVDARVTSGALQPGDFTEGANITITEAADGVTIASAGGGTSDGVVDGGSVTGTTLTLTRTESLAPVTIAGVPSAEHAGVSCPATAPTTAGELSTNPAGGLCVGADEIDVDTTPGSIDTQDLMSISDWGGTPNLYQGVRASVNSNVVNNHDRFFFNTTYNLWYQNRSGSTLSTTWAALRCST